MDFIDVCVHPPRNMFCFQAVEIGLGHNTVLLASEPDPLCSTMTLRQYLEWVCLHSCCLLFHPFLCSRTILTHTVQKEYASNSAGYVTKKKKPRRRISLDGKKAG